LVKGGEDSSEPDLPWGAILRVFTCDPGRIGPFSVCNPGRNAVSRTDTGRRSCGGE